MLYTNRLKTQPGVSGQLRYALRASLRATSRHSTKEMKIALFTVLAFIAGFTTNRLLVQAEVEELEERITAAVGKLWGYEDSEAKEFIGILGSQYSPEELHTLMSEMAALGGKMEELYFDERLLGAIRGLAYLQILKEEGKPTLEEKIRGEIQRFYDDYKSLLDNEPSNEQEKTMIGALRRIESELPNLNQKNASNQVGDDNSE